MKQDLTEKFSKKRKAKKWFDDRIGKQVWNTVLQSSLFVIDSTMSKRLYDQ